MNIIYDAKLTIHWNTLDKIWYLTVKAENPWIVFYLGFLLKGKTHSKKFALRWYDILSISREYGNARKIKEYNITASGNGCISTAKQVYRIMKKKKLV